MNILVRRIIFPTDSSAGWLLLVEFSRRLNLDLRPHLYNPIRWQTEICGRACGIS